DLLQLGGELGHRCRPATGERLEHEAPVRVGEGLEDGVYATAHAASARSSNAVDHSGDDSTTTSRVPSGTGSSVKTTSPPSSSQRSVSSRSGSTSSTLTLRSSPFPQRKTPRPPGLGSSSTSVANQSSSCSGSVSASQTSAGSAGKTISRRTSMST